MTEYLNLHTSDNKSRDDSLNLFPGVGETALPGISIYSTHEAESISSNTKLYMVRVLCHLKLSENNFA